MATLSDTFTNNWNTSGEVAPDELLAKYTGNITITSFDTEQFYTGRSSLMKFNLAKPNRNGLELWKNCAQSSYCLWFICNMNQDWTKTQVIQKLVKHFPAERCNCITLYIDAGYGSDKLADWLHSCGFRFTIVAAKNQPHTIFNGLHSKLQKGETAYCVRGDNAIVAFVYYSTKLVNVFTNVHNTANFIKWQEKQKKSANTITFYIPEPVMKY